MQPTVRAFNRPALWKQDDFAGLILAARVGNHTDELIEEFSDD
jgi:hypothetical protein